MESLRHLDGAEAVARICARFSRACPHVALTALPWAVVHGEPCVFYPRRLRTAPGAVATLAEIAESFGFTACRDRRERSVTVVADRRRCLAVALGFSMSLACRGPLSAETTHTGVTADATAAAAAFQLPPAGRVPGAPVVTRDPAGRLRLGTRPLAAARVLPGAGALAPCGAARHPEPIPCVAPAPAHVAAMERFLRTHLAGEDGAVRGAAARAFGGELAAVARYYSQFPEVRRIIADLDATPVRLRPTPERWETRAELTGDTVGAVTVFFDFRLAARMHFGRDCAGQPACTATPADALLHELLHAHLMFQDPQRFTASVRATGYPHAHEAEVIARERQLYAAMSRRDGLPRPARHRHLARLVAVDCPLCWGTD